MVSRRQVWCPWCHEYVRQQTGQIFATHVFTCPAAPDSVKAAYLDPLDYPLPR